MMAKRKLGGVSAELVLRSRNDGCAHCRRKQYCRMAAQKEVYALNEARWLCQ